MAYRRYNANLPPGKELLQKDLGQLVAARLGRPAFLQSTVSTWMNLESPQTPDNVTLDAIAIVLNVDPVWLIFGERRRLG